MTACPCGCGLHVPDGVAQRDRGIRAGAAHHQPTTRIAASRLPAVLLLTGAPGAGKSTVARILAGCFDRAAHVDIDWVLHHLTVSGLVPPDSPSDESDRQIRLALRNVSALAANFHDDGFFAVVEGAVADRESVNFLRSALAPRRFMVAVLAPAAEVSAERDRLRGGKQVAHLFPHLHDQIAGELSNADIRIDSAGQDPETTATLLLSLVLRQAEPV